MNTYEREGEEVASQKHIMQSKYNVFNEVSITSHFLCIKLVAIHFLHLFFLLELKENNLLLGEGEGGKENVY